jgi:hypothetical protein
MQKYKFGVFAEDYQRTLESGSLLYEFRQHKGQVILSDGTNCRTCSDFDIEHATESVLVQMFELEDKHREEMKRLGGASENLTTFKNNDKYPLIWASSFEDAKLKHEPSPNGVVSTSTNL